MTSIEETQKPMKVLRDLINNGDIAMMVTKTDDGQLRSRPMQTCHVLPTGELVFFTQSHAELTRELTDDNFVNLSYGQQEQDDYISISGVARINQNQSDMETFWQQEFKRWIPDGLDDPTLAMVLVDPLHAEHWGFNDPRKSLGKLLAYSEQVPSALYEKIGNN